MKPEATIVSNPIIPGFAPDPSITCVDGTFFLVNSSFHLFPGLPIFASTDLARWTHVGNAINRVSQISLAESTTLIHRGETTLVGTGGLYAPTIRHHQGSTYIICTNVNYPKPVNNRYPDFQNFIVRSTDLLSGKWSDPVFFDFNGIDPDLFFDDDGRAYVVGSSWNTDPGTINGFEIDVDTGAKRGDEQVIWGGVIRHIPEGPHLYKRDGHYYLLIAEGGTHDNHQVSIARAESPLGPYESCERNPILRPTTNLETDVVYTGHGDLFQGADGEWWFTCLGVRKIGDGRTSIMGRETFLTPAQWKNGGDADPWPVLEQPIGLTVSLPIPAASPLTGPRRLMSKTGVDWVWIRNPDLDSYRVSSAEHHVSLRPSGAGLDCAGDQPVTFLGKRQRELAGEARATLSLPLLDESGGLAGLAYYKDEHRYATIAFNSATSAFVFEAVNRAKDQPLLRSEHFPVSRDGELDGSPDAEFRLAHTEKSLQFFYRLRVAGDAARDIPWSVGGVLDTEALTDHDFTGPCIGVFATLPAGMNSDEAGWRDFYDVNLV